MRKKVKKLRLFSFLTGLVLLISATFGCAKSISAVDFYAFSTVVHVEVYDGKISSEEKNEITALLTSLEKTFSVSGLGITEKFNSSDTTSPIETNATFNEVYNIAKKAYLLTDGKFDATVFPLVKLWQFYPDFPVSNFIIPDDDKISAELLKIGFDKTSLTEIDGKTYLSKTQDDVSIDFGGIAKGYAADKIAEILKTNGHKNGYVNVGTSSLNLLSVESLGIRHPEKSGEKLLDVDLSNITDVSVSTSGTYEKYYEKNGKRYSHIINPATGYPANTGVLSVTVLCKDGTLADGITTALCLCAHDYNDTETDELVSLIKKIVATDELKDSIFFAAVSDGTEKQLVTNAKKDSFTLYDDTYEIVFIG